MKHLAALLGAASILGVASPAFAQHSGHMPGMVMPPSKPAPKPVVKKPPAKIPARMKPVAKKPVAKESTSTKPATEPVAADPHAGHDMSAMPGDMSGGEMDAMPGMDMPGMDKPGDMSGHDMSAMPGVAPSGTDLQAGNSPAPPIPADHAADIVYDAGAMAMSRHHLDSHGGQKFAKVMFNLAEYQAHKGRGGYQWDGEAWYGGDIDKLWLKSEGEGTVGGPLERAELQALYSHAIGPYFNLQGGARYDFRPNPSRAYAVLAVEGLAPYWFDVEGSLFLSNKGELMARAEGTYDQRITQRLILQPRVELNFAAQSSREIGVGSGFSDAEIGLRLRYAFAREFAPYVGVQYKRSFGDTAKYLREEGEDPSVLSLVGGIRFWF